MPTQPALSRVSTACSRVGLSLLGAGLLALAAVEASLLVRHEPTSVESTAPALPLGAKQSPTAAPPERAGNVISITADTTTLGTTLYRLWGSGRIEASVLGEQNVWTEWVPVAPGLKGSAPAPKKPDSQY
jgi:hypothetical protein